MGIKNVKPLAENDNWCKGGTIKSRFHWTIEGFKTREEEKGQCLNSNSFKICDPEGKVSTWYLQLYPRGAKRTGDGNCVSLLLCLKDDFKLKIDFEMFLLDANLSKMSVGFKSQEFDNNKTKYFVLRLYD